MQGIVRTTLLGTGIAAAFALLWIALVGESAPTVPQGEVAEVERDPPPPGTDAMTSTSQPVVAATETDDPITTAEASSTRATDRTPEEREGEKRPARLPISLEGRLLWDPSVNHGDFVVTCRRGDGKELNVYLGPDGRFRRFDMRPGSIDLMVHIRGDDIALVTVHDVVIPDGGTSADPRLHAIDVTDVKRVELTFVTPHGDPIRGRLHALLLQPDGKAGRHAHGRALDGILPILIRNAGVLAVVWASGHPPQRVELRDDRIITFTERTLVRIRVTIDGPIAENDPGVESIAVDFAPAGTKPRKAEGSSPLAFLLPEPEPKFMRPEDIPATHAVDTERGEQSAVWTYAVTRPGEYVAWLESWFARSSPEDENVELGRQTVTVDALGDTTEVSFTVPAQALRPGVGKRENR